MAGKDLAMLASVEDLFKYKTQLRDLVNQGRLQLIVPDSDEKTAKSIDHILNSLFEFVLAGNIRDIEPPLLNRSSFMSRRTSGHYPPPEDWKILTNAMNKVGVQPSTPGADGGSAEQSGSVSPLQTNESIAAKIRKTGSTVAQLVVDVSKVIEDPRIYDNKGQLRKKANLMDQFLMFLYPTYRTIRNIGKSSAFI
jgi:hypothetical protein